MGFMMAFIGRQDVSMIVLAGPEGGPRLRRAAMMTR
jgi:hypothetical protein